MSTPAAVNINYRSAHGLGTIQLTGIGAMMSMSELPNLRAPTEATIITDVIMSGSTTRARQGEQAF